MIISNLIELNKYTTWYLKSLHLKQYCQTWAKNIKNQTYHLTYQSTISRIEKKNSTTISDNLKPQLTIKAANIWPCGMSVCSSFREPVALSFL